jgi:hypothetical protein
VHRHSTAGERSGFVDAAEIVGQGGAAALPVIVGNCGNFEEELPVALFVDPPPAREVTEVPRRFV